MPDIVAVARVAEPGEVLLTVSVTMTVTHWRRFREQLASPEYESWHLTRAVSEALERFTAAHEGTSDYVRG